MTITVPVYQHCTCLYVPVYQHCTCLPTLYLSTNIIYQYCTSLYVPVVYHYSQPDHFYPSSLFSLYPHLQSSMNRMAIQALEKMETRKFKAKVKGQRESSYGASDSLSSSSTTDCAICLEKYMEGEVLDTQTLNRNTHTLFRIFLGRKGLASGTKKHGQKLNLVSEVCRNMYSIP